MTPILTTVNNRDSWNDFVRSSPYGHILQSWEWGEIKAATGWRPLRLAIQDDGGIRAAAQVLLRPLPYRLGSMAYVPKGPVLDYRDTALLERVVAGLKQVSEAEGVIALKIEPEIIEPNVVASRLRSLGLTPSPPVQMRSTIWVDLSSTEGAIQARQHHKTRYNTRLAGRKGVSVREGTSSDLGDWYEMYRVTAVRDGFTVHSLEYYRTVLDTLLPRNMARFLLAYHEGDLLAEIIVFHLGRTAQYMYGASSNIKRNLMAPYLVQWEGMRWAKARGAIVYDLWGIPDHLRETEDLWGVYRHKKGYGGEVVRYIGAYDSVRTPIRHFAVERAARPLYKRLTRRSLARME